MASIQGIYIALFGRPADPLGLDYFNEVTTDGQDLSQIGNLAGQPEYIERFAGKNNAQIVTQIYNDLFGRNPEAAGLAFFVAQLESGAQTINTIAINILDGAEGPDADIVAAKIEAADQFTAAVRADPDALAAYSGDSGKAFGMAFLEQIDSGDDELTDEQVQAQVEAFGNGDTNIPGIPGTPGEVFTLTAPGIVGNVDNVTGTDDADTFRAPAGALNTEDSVDGAGGFDTLNAVLTGGEVAPVLKNIERLNFDVTAASTFNAEAASGIEQIWAVGDNGVGGADQLLTVTNVTTAVTIGMADNSDGVTVEFEGVSGNSDTANLALDGSGTGDRITVSGVENVNVDVLSDSAFQLSANGAETVTISGEGDLAFNVVGANGPAQQTLATLESVDASGLDGNLTFSEAVENDFSIVTGAGNDSITIAAAAAGDDVTISTGAGNDTINVDAAVPQAVGPAIAGVAGSVVITGGAGADVITLQSVGATAEATVVYGAQSDSTYTNFDSITNFVTGTDTLDFSALGLDGATNTVAVGNTTNTTIGQFAGGVDNFFEVGGDTLAVATFTEGGFTYVLADVDGNGDFNAATDLVVQLTGGATVAAGDINFG